LKSFTLICLFTVQVLTGYDEDKLSCLSKYGHVLKTTQLSTYAQNHANLEQDRKAVTMIVLNNDDFLLKASVLAVLQHLWQFLVKWLFMSFL